MQKCEEQNNERTQFRLKPAPPKLSYQAYIDLYLEQKDEKYLSWFLHHYESKINESIDRAIAIYAMEGHFDGLKGAYLLGLTQALLRYDKSRSTSFLSYKEFYTNAAIHDYIRTMRTGYTIQSRDEDAMLRKAMAIFAEYDYRDDDETIALIAKAIDRKPQTVRDLLMGGLRNMGCVDFYRKYSDDDGEDSAEEAHGTSSTDPYHMLLRKELEEALLTAFENLDYRERAIVSEHLGFCPECFTDSQLVTDNTGRKRKQRITPKAFIDIAYDHGLASPASADRIYRKALKKLRKAILEKNGI